MGAAFTAARVVQLACVLERKMAVALLNLCLRCGSSIVLRVNWWWPFCAPYPHNIDQAGGGTICAGRCCCRDFVLVDRRPQSFEDQRKADASSNQEVGARLPPSLVSSGTEHTDASG
jgi:hypothetical protein